jgi:hypothetical protein
MFMIFKNGRPAGNQYFPTYEKARQHARKLLRKRVNYVGSNPHLHQAGYTIHRV